MMLEFEMHHCKVLLTGFVVSKQVLFCFLSRDRWATRVIKEGMDEWTNGRRELASASRKGPMRERTHISYLVQGK